VYISGGGRRRTRDFRQNNKIFLFSEDAGAGSAGREWSLQDARQHYILVESSCLHATSSIERSEIKNTYKKVKVNTCRLDVHGMPHRFPLLERICCIKSEK